MTPFQARYLLVHKLCCGDSPPSRAGQLFYDGDRSILGVSTTASDPEVIDATILLGLALTLPQGDLALRPAQRVTVIAPPPFAPEIKKRVGALRRTTRGPLDGWLPLLKLFDRPWLLTSAPDAWVAMGFAKGSVILPEWVRASLAPLEG